MKRLLLVLALLCASSVTFACDTYTSTTKAPGKRLLLRDPYSGELTLKEGKKSRHFGISSAGTGSGVMVAIPDDNASDPLQIDYRNGIFWLGPERFKEFCK